jgi:hypothetical protein
MRVQPGNISILPPLNTPDPKMAVAPAARVQPKLEPFLPLLVT